VWRVWKRFRRRSFAPRSPAVYPDQWGLILVCGIVIVGGLVVAAAVLIA
jgi:hypothetical protein